MRWHRTTLVLIALVERPDSSRTQGDAAITAAGVDADAYAIGVDPYTLTWTPSGS